MYIASFLSLLGFMETVLAGCPRVVTLGTVIPSEKLVWLPCYDGFHCAKLLVSLSPQPPYLVSIFNVMISTGTP